MIADYYLKKLYCHSMTVYYEYLIHTLNILK